MFISPEFKKLYLILPQLEADTGLCKGRILYTSVEIVENKQSDKSKQFELRE